MGFDELADQVARACTRTLGTSLACTFTPQGGAPESVRVVFDRAHVDVDAATDRPILSTEPVAGVRLADLSATPAQGDLLTVGETTYTVRRVEPDGLAGADLFLHEVPA